MRPSKLQETIAFTLSSPSCLGPAALTSTSDNKKLVFCHQSRQALCRRHSRMSLVTHTGDSGPVIPAELTLSITQILPLTQILGGFQLTCKGIFKLGLTNYSGPQL